MAHGVGIPSSVTAAASRLSAEVAFDPVDAPSAEAKRRAARAESCLLGTKFLARGQWEALPADDTQWASLLVRGGRAGFEK